MKIRKETWYNAAGANLVTECRCDFGKAEIIRAQYEDNNAPTKIILSTYPNSIIAKSIGEDGIQLDIQGNAEAYSILKALFEAIRLQLEELD